MQVQVKSIDVDDSGILSIFYSDGKIISIPICLEDNIMSSELIHLAPPIYTASLYKIIDTINNYVLSTMTVDIESDDDFEKLTSKVTAVISNDDYKDYLNGCYKKHLL